jgi:nicotinamidase-related amidase
MIKIKRVLVVTDVQVGFTLKGVLANHYVTYIVPELIRLIEEEFSGEEDEVIFLFDSHDEYAVEFKRFNNKQHTVDGEEEAEIIPELKPYTEGRKIFKKNCTMIYALKEYREYLEKNSEIEEMVFVGLLKDMCVFDGAYSTKKHFEQENRDVRVIVPQNASATYSWPGHDEKQMSEIANIMLNQVGIETPKVYRKVMK